MKVITFYTLFTGALVQASAFAQCGGTGWTSAATCASGYTCAYVNEYYSQCVPVNTASKIRSVPLKSSRSMNSFKWFGLDESVAEFGTGKYPGTYGVDFRFPDENSIGTLMSEGFNTFRIPFAMERLAANTLTSPLQAAYLANLTQVVNYITNKGGYAILDPHNFGRYYGNVITDVAGFQTFWKNVATAFKSNSRAIFDTNNEYHDMDQTLVLNLNQAAIDGIRSAGAVSQYIFAEGNSYSGAWTWAQVNDNLKALKDPQGKLVYEMHQYLDSDGSGTSATCVNSTIGADRVASATAWLRTNGKQGVLGEFAGGAKSVCKSAVTGLLDHLKSNNDVWQGALWWSAGPWWGDYIYSFEPPSGTAYVAYDALLRSYL